MNANTAFAAIQRSLETFDAEVGRARADQAASLETLAAVEYELVQLRKLLSESARTASAAVPAAEPLSSAASVSDVEVSGENVGGGLLRRLVSRAA